MWYNYSYLHITNNQNFFNCTSNLYLHSFITIISKKFWENVWNMYYEEKAIRILTCVSVILYEIVPYALIIRSIIEIHKDLFTKQYVNYLSWQLLNGKCNNYVIRLNHLIEQL